MSENNNPAKTTTQSRWRSKVLWASIAAQMLVIAKIIGLWDMIGVDESVASDLVAAALQMLAIVGVLNDPTNRKGW